MRTVSITLEINAPIENVWEKLSNINEYKYWNPFVTKITAPNSIPKEGTMMAFEVRFHDGKTANTKELVTKFSPPAQNNNLQAEWIYRFDGFMHNINMVRAKRTQRLIAVSNNTTKYFSIEIFTGWAAFLVPYKKVEKGFWLQGNALKKICEKDLTMS